MGDAPLGRKGQILYVIIKLMVMLGDHKNIIKPKYITLIAIIIIIIEVNLSVICHWLGLKILVSKKS